jgi:hypothetical protein
MVRGRKPNIVRRQEAARLRRAGLNMVEIGRLMGITKQAVHQLLTGRRRADIRQLTETLILQWVDEHNTATGQWPHSKSGPVQGQQGETWSALDLALREGRRGLQGSSSLACFLAKHRAVRATRGRPRKPLNDEPPAP